MDNINIIAGPFCADTQVGASVHLAITYIACFLVVACTPNRRPQSVAAAINTATLAPDASNEQLQERLEGQVILLPTQEWVQIRRVEQRLRGWLAHVNALRSMGQQLALETEEQSREFPIEAPHEYSRLTILRDFRGALSALPERVRLVLLDEMQSYPDNFLMEEQEFLRIGLALDRVYGLSLRWDFYIPNLSFYLDRDSDDIRGYYFLQKETNLESKLHGWTTLDQETQQRYSQWLIGICRNADIAKALCRTQWQESVDSANVWAFYQRYFEAARARYLSFFSISADVRRGDTKWEESEGKEKLWVTFLQPSEPGLGELLQSIVSAAWARGAWQAGLEFSTSADPDFTAHIVMAANSVPSVDGAGGSIISMDTTRLKNDFATRSSFAHEFGHVLGFRDCYVEFFDQERGLMVNYQIDTQNIMCSHRGKVLESHYLELKRVYGLIH